MYQKWHSYDVWFLSYGARQANLFNILGLFLPSYPTKFLKNQNFKKMKIHLEILSFYTSAPKIMIISHTVFEIWCATDVIFLFFALGYHHFIHVHRKLWSHDIWFRKNGAKQTDKQMNRQIKWHIKVGAPPKNNVKVIQILWSQIILIAVLITGGLEIT